MSGALSVLLLIVLGLLLWGLVAPRHIGKKLKKEYFARKHAVVWFGSIVVTLFVLIGITAPQTKPTASHISSAQSQPQVKGDSVTRKQVTETQTVAFTVKDQNDSSIPKGKTKVVQAGKDGIKKLTYNVEYTNGQQTNKTLVASTVVTKPVTQIVDVGTYVAPTHQYSSATTSTAPVTHHTSATPTNCANGTYVNSSGNTVCKPETSSTVPAGATAKCRDGTYSFSQHHSGTCSHHGGVAEWL